MDAEQEWVKEVLRFWFKELEPAQWFRADEALDAEITERFGGLIASLRVQPVSSLLGSPERALAAILVLDQFSRNVHRGQAEAFAQDALALKVAEGAIKAGFDEALPKERKHFTYMPFMHAEDRQAQRTALRLFGSLNDANTMKFAKDHAEVIERFGRYPYRNEVLGRQSTPEEIEYLKEAKTYGQ